MNKLVILVLEDLVHDYELMVQAFSRSRIQFTAYRIENKKDFIKSVRDLNPDVILADYQLDEFSGLDAIHYIRNNHPDIPVILVTGTQSEEVAVECIKQGAYDYILKKSLTRLPSAVLNAVEFRKSEREKKNAVEKLRKSELKYRKLFRNSPIPFFVYDASSLKIFAVNAAAIREYGYTLREFLKLTMSDILHKEDHHSLTDYPADSKTAVHQLKYWRHIKKDGTVFYVEMISHEIDYEGHKARIALARNVTEEKTTQEKLVMLAQSLKSISECVSITDTNNKTLFVNEAFQNTYGFKEEEILGKDISIVGSGTNSDKLHREILEKTLKGGWHGEMINKKKDGTEFPVFLSTSIVKDNSGNAIALIGVARDITERRKIMTELIAAKEKAEEANRLKTAFLSTMSHEIRTPLNAILGYTQILDAAYSNVINPEDKYFFEGINNASQRLLSTITQILDISRLEAGDFRLKIKPVSIAKVISDVIHVVKPLAGEKNLVIKTDINPPDIQITTDEYCLNGVILNLLSNSIKYSNQGSILITAEERDDKIFFSVLDEGIGMSEEYQKHLFETFSQEDTGLSRKFEGTGLGLAITKRYIDLLEGSIKIESKKDEGTKAYFILPKILQ